MCGGERAGGPLDPADVLRRATSHPCLCLASWKVCLAFGEVLWGRLAGDGEGLSARASWGGRRGIRSCPPGTGVTCPLSSGLVFSRPGS